MSIENILQPLDCHTQLGFFRAIPYLALKLSHQLTVAILVSKVHPVTVWVVGVSDIPYWCCSCVIIIVLVQDKYNI